MKKLRGLSVTEVWEAWVLAGNDPFHLIPASPLLAEARLDGWMVGWTGGWVDGWTDKSYNNN